MGVLGPFFVFLAQNYGPQDIWIENLNIPQLSMDQRCFCEFSFLQPLVFELRL